jgi:hypothetical protein
VAPDASPAIPDTEGVGSTQANRIRDLTAQRWNEHRARVAAEARARQAEDALARANSSLAQFQQPTPDGVPQARPRTYTEAEVADRVQWEARNIAFNEQCNTLYNAGCAAHPDFPQVLTQLRQMVGGQLPREFVEAAMKTKSPHEVIYALGKDPAKASSVMELDPYQQIAEMAELAYTMRGKSNGSAQAPSSAPPPVGGHLGANTNARPISLDDSSLSMDQWVMERERQIAAARERQRK